STGRVTASAFMVVTGLGLGMNLQVLTVIVQNAVEWRDLGVATAGLNFFRNLGGSLGTAVSLSIFGGRLTRLLAPIHVGAEVHQGSPAAIRALAPATRNSVEHAFASALHGGFLWAIPLAG